MNCYTCNTECTREREGGGEERDNFLPRRVGKLFITSYELLHLGIAAAAKGEIAV